MFCLYISKKGPKDALERSVFCSVSLLCFPAPGTAGRDGGICQGIVVRGLMAFRSVRGLFPFFFPMFPWELPLFPTKFLCGAIQGPARCQSMSWLCPCARSGLPRVACVDLLTPLSSFSLSVLLGCQQLYLRKGYKNGLSSPCPVCAHTSRLFLLKNKWLLK